MPMMQPRPSTQTGAANTLLYIALSALVAVGVGMAIYFLSQDKNAGETAVQSEGDANPYARTEPPQIAPVDMQTTDIDDRSARSGSGARGTDATGLFEREGKKMPLTDGLAGGSETGTGPRNGDVPLNAVDGFDYGVLDGRIRVGVFAKGPIPDYRVTVRDGRYVIEMPGEFRYVEEFSRRLNMQHFGVSSAQLLRDERGMRLVIEVTPDLKHEPFLIEDNKGLIVAFEPRRG